MSAAGDNLSAAAQHLPDVERRRCWSILEGSCLSLAFLVCQATRKTVALHLTLLVLQGEKSGRWSSARARHGAFSNKSCAHRFAPKYDPPWPRLDSAVSNSPPRARSCALCNDQMLKSWINIVCACDETRPGSIAKTCSHAVSAHAVDFETKLETSRGVHWQRWTPPPPPCVRACIPWSKQVKNGQKVKSRGTAFTCRSIFFLFLNL